MAGKLRPRYHYFKGYSAAKGYADNLNARAWKNYWLVKANGIGGYTVYNVRRARIT